MAKCLFSKEIVIMQTAHIAATSIGGAPGGSKPNHRLGRYASKE